MEWTDSPYSPFDETLCALLSESPQFEKPPEWTPEENKLFEGALADFDINSPDFFENVASRLPWRPIQEVKIHYQTLLEDVTMIDTGNIPVPDYQLVAVQETQAHGEENKGKEVKVDEGSPSNEAKAKSSQQRRRGIPWTENEHQLFLMGLNKYGKGDWRSISRYYVMSKTPTQVASHAQKYFRRQNSTTPADRRRPSIHDIQTVCPTAYARASASSSSAQRHINAFTNMDQATPFSSHGSLIHSFNGVGYGVGGAFGGVGAVDQNPMFLPNMGSTYFPNAAPIYNGASSSAYPEPSAPYPYPNQHYWG